MPQETGNFKSRLFGGFDRHDVIEYIEELAAERNALQRENEELRAQLDEAMEMEPAVSTDLGEDAAKSVEQYKKQKSEILAKTKETLCDLWEKYDSVCGDLKVNVTQIQGELTDMGVLLGGLVDSMASVGLRLKELYDSIYDDVDSDDDVSEEAENATDV